MESTRAGLGLSLLLAFTYPLEYVRGQIGSTELAAAFFSIAFGEIFKGRNDDETTGTNPFFRDEVERVRIVDSRELHRPTFTREFGQRNIPAHCDLVYVATKSWVALEGEFSPFRSLLLLL